MEKSPATHTPHLDRMAVALSGICLLHCVAVSLIVVAAPALAGLVFGDGWMHLAMLVVVIPLSAIALPRGYRDHGRTAPLWLGAAGLALLILGATAGHHVYGPAADTSLTVTGAIVLALAHILNALWCAGTAPA